MNFIRSFLFYCGNEIDAFDNAKKMENDIQNEEYTKNQYRG